MLMVAACAPRPRPAPTPPRVEPTSVGALAAAIEADAKRSDHEPDPKIRGELAAEADRGAQACLTLAPAAARGGAGPGRGPRMAAGSGRRRGGIGCRAPRSYAPAALPAELARAGGGAGGGRGGRRRPGGR